MIQYYSIRNQASIYGETTSTDKVKLLRAAWFAGMKNEAGWIVKCMVGHCSQCNRITLGRVWPFPDL